MKNLNYSSILIITYGRSGSTLLQGVLNSIDGVLVRGENYNFCYSLFKGWQSINQAKCYYSPLEKDPWFGSHLLNDRLFTTQCKNLLYNLLLANRVHDPKIKCYGFKEIRYIPEDIGNDIEDYLQFLNKIFPNLGLIFNTRNMEDVCKSNWWKEREYQNVIKTLSETEHNFISYMKKFPENTFHISYEDIVYKSDRLVKMFDFIGCDYDELKIEKVLAIKHG